MVKKFLTFLILFVSALIFLNIHALHSVNVDMTATESAQTKFSILKEVQLKDNMVSITLDKLAPFNVFKVGAPPRLVVELIQTENDWKTKVISPEKNPIFTRIRSGQFQNEPVKIARVVMELRAPVEFETKTEGETIWVITKKMEKEGVEPMLTTITNSQLPPNEETTLIKHSTTLPLSTPLVSPTPSLILPKTSTQETSQTTPIQPLNNEPILKENLHDPSDPTTFFGRQLVTLDFFDIEIKDLFKILGDKAGVNVVFGSNVSGTVSIQLKDVPFKDAVSTILTLKNLKIISLGKNILQIMTAEEFDQYKTKAISVTKIFQVNYAKAGDVNTQLISILSTLSGKGKTLVDDRTNSIIVTDTPEGIELVNKLIGDLDKPTPQVMIEAKIVQVTLGKSLDLGITWGAAYTDKSGNQMITIGAAKASKAASSADAETPGSGSIGLMTRTPLNPSGGSDLEASGAGFTPGQGLGLSFGFVKDVVRLNAALSALAQKNKSKLLSNPKVATLNNKPASIKSEISEPYITTETQLTNAGTLTSQKVNTAKSGITLTVTPTINADGRITLKIVPDITSSQPTSIGIPKTTSQQADTTVIVKDGETFVIGGLISELESDQKAYIPILGRIPILGHLFKKTGTSKTRAELLVFVTPKIIPY